MARLCSWCIRAAAIIAATLLLAAPARAGCNPSDIFNDAKDTFTGLQSCVSACATGVGCGAAAFMTSVLGGVAAEGGQGAVDSFCSQAEGVNDVDKIIGYLKSAGGSSLGQVADVLNSAGSVSSVVKCACDTEQGAGSLGSDIGKCVENLLCGLQEDLGMEPCNCTRPGPQVANCAAVDLKKCDAEGSIYEQWHDPACIAPGSISNTNWKCENTGGTMTPWQPTVSCTTTSEGTFVRKLPPSAEGTGCDPVQYCFCPAPMKADWRQVPNPGSEYDRYVFACECPDGTHPAGTMPNGISACLCDNTNQPPIFPPLIAPQGICPPPACPAGQVRLDGTGNCVTPCSDPKQGMAFDGSCCNPAQMTTCGQCCPPDTIPDAKSGTCVPRPQPPK